jgi:hypothetical protein
MYLKRRVDSTQELLAIQVGGTGVLLTMACSYCMLIAHYMLISMLICLLIAFLSLRLSTAR